MLKNTDVLIYELIEKEKSRQSDNLELIASENYVSSSVREAQGSILTNKYAEGYPNKRYYGGCINVDGVESLAIERVKKLFNCSFANVQPHSGTQANMGVYRALLQNGDVVLGMALDHGGHLSHGSPLSFSGIDYKFIPYHLKEVTYEIDFDEIRELAKTYKPKLIVCGASSYPLQIDFKKFSEIAKEFNSYLMVDAAHIAGLIITSNHPHPFPYADVVTSTTHKTLRGPRGGIILTNNEEIAKKIDKVVFPGIQGGPLMHVIASKAVAFHEASLPSFKEYIDQVVINSTVLANELKSLGYTLIADKTENHLCVVDVLKTLNITGLVAEKTLDQVLITCNKNCIPFDTLKPFITSGIRLGTPALTSRGFKEDEMRIVARLIDRALRNIDKEDILEEVKQEVLALTKKFPLN